MVLIIYFYFNKNKSMKKINFENSLGNETLEVLGFKTTDALEQELNLLTQDIYEEKTNIARMARESSY